MRRMLISAIHREESRVAIAEDDRLLELEIERADQIQLKGNIYRASISRVEPSLQAAFLDIGSNRNGFLQINDIHSTYFEDGINEGSSNRSARPPIQEVLKAGQELVVQVVKDERDAKGATLTTNLSIPGRYLVLMIGNQRGGVSRKIADEGHRKRLKQALQQLLIPPGMGVIVRTAGLNKTSTELQRDLDGLLEIWHDLVQKSLEPGTPNLLYFESDLAIRSIRDYLRSDFDEVWIDDKATFDRAHRFVEKIVPTLCSRLFFYEKPIPLFAHFRVEEQVRATTQAEVTLPSGGSIVISPTEAVVAIDVNSGRSTSQSDVEQTAFETNKEAAEAIARQLRLRDLGGLIIIDFIDMIDKRHKQVVEKTLKDSVRGDRAKVEVGRISRFGLMEMSRQRLKGALIMQNHHVCPHCRGRGLVRMADSAALEALRKIETAVFAGGVKSVRVHLAPAAALFLLNEKRRALLRLEDEAKATVLVFADSRLKPEEYELMLNTTSVDLGRDSSHELSHSSHDMRNHHSHHHSGDRPDRQGGRPDRKRNMPKQNRPTRGGPMGQETRQEQPRRDSRNDNRNDSRSDTPRPDSRRDSRPESRSEVHPDGRSEPRPDSRRGDNNTSQNGRDERRRDSSYRNSGRNRGRRGRPDNRQSRPRGPREEGTTAPSESQPVEQTQQGERPERATPVE